MRELVDHLAADVLAIVGALPEEVRRDIYVLELTLCLEHEDARYPIWLLSYNTLSHLGKQTIDFPRQSPSYLAADPQYFVGWQVAELGATDREDPGSPLRQSWLEKLGLWYRDNEAHDLEDIRAPELRLAALDLTAEWIRNLQARQALPALVGKLVPVLVLPEYDVDLDEVGPVNFTGNPASVHPELRELIAGFRAYPPERT